MAKAGFVLRAVKSPWGRGVLATAGVGSLSAVIGLYGKLPDILRAMAAQPWICVVVYLGLIAFVLFGGFFILEARHSRLAGVSNLWDPHNKLFNWVYNSAQCNVHEVDCDIAVREDYSVHIVQRILLSAATQPLFAFPAQRGSKNAALEDGQSISFGARLGAGSGTARICTVPAQDHSNQKRFLVYFLPPLQPTEPQVELILTHTWPKAAIKLAGTSGTDQNEILVPPQAVGKVGRIRLKITLPKVDTRFRVETSNGDVELPDPNGVLSWQTEFIDMNPAQVIGFTVRRLSN